MKKVLTIAGSDCSGGAGIQADLKTFAMNGVYGMSVITAITAQNTTEVKDIMYVGEDLIKEQLDMVFTDIFPDAVKIGMVGANKQIEIIAERLLYYKAKNIVIDPVMISTSGCKLMNDGSINIMISKLLPLANLITPNIFEASVLSNMQINKKDDMLKACKIIYDLIKCPILIKGGHSVNVATDILYDGKDFVEIVGNFINNKNTHGTGCTLSSAISANMAKNFSIKDSIIKAKKYLEGALNYMLDIGNGVGPMNHCYNLNGEFLKENE